MTRRGVAGVVGWDTVAGSRQMCCLEPSQNNFYTNSRCNGRMDLCVCSFSPSSSLVDKK